MSESVVADKSLKPRNFKWLCSLTGADALILLAFVTPEWIGKATLTQITVARAILALAMPVLVLLLSSLLSSNVKASLVYFKGRQALPGHEAFSRHGPADSRIDMVALKRNVRTLPTTPAEQNALWYKLYKKVMTDAAVVEAHRSYLMFRDMAAVSVLLTPIAPLVLYVNGVALGPCWGAAGLFAVQYLATATAARHSGVRLVNNVLAVHSVKRVT